jgi:hypothetical protein
MENVGSHMAAAVAAQRTAVPSGGGGSALQLSVSAPTSFDNDFYDDVKQLRERQRTDEMERGNADATQQSPTASKELSTVITDRYTREKAVLVEFGLEEDAAAAFLERVASREEELWDTVWQFADIALNSERQLLLSVLTDEFGFGVEAAAALNAHYETHYKDHYSPHNYVMMVYEDAEARVDAVPLLRAWKDPPLDQWIPSNKLQRPDHVRDQNNMVYRFRMGVTDTGKGFASRDSPDVGVEDWILDDIPFDITNCWYHATTKEHMLNIMRYGIDVTKGRPRLDFFKSGAFYVGSSLRAALYWCWKKVAGMKGKATEFAIVVYHDLDALCNNVQQLQPSQYRFFDRKSTKDIDMWRKWIWVCRKQPREYPPELKNFATQVNMNAARLIRGPVLANPLDALQKWVPHASLNQMATNLDSIARDMDERVRAVIQVSMDSGDQEDGSEADEAPVTVYASSSSSSSSSTTPATSSGFKGWGQNPLIKQK